MTSIGQLTEQFTILQPTATTNPDTGGQVPGPPVEIAKVRGALAPLTATESLATLGRVTQQDLGIVNTATHVLTTWFRPDVTVGQYIEYQDAKRQAVRHFEITQVSSPDERGVWLVVGCVERV
jgi:head-tail adaptor